MNKRWLGQWIGLGIFLAGAWGVWWLFTSMPVAEEESEAAVETVVPVRVGTITRRTLHAYVQAYGSVVPDPGTGERSPARISVTSPLDSQITGVSCWVGQQVKQDQLLFSLYDREARLAEEAARQYVDIARKNLERQEKLKAVESTSEKLLLEAQQQWEQAQSRWIQSQVALELYQVAAPVAGTILDIQVRTGQAVVRSEVLATLVDLDRLVIQTGVPSSQVGAVRPGQDAEILVPGSEDSSAPAMLGKVIYVDTQTDPDSDTVMVLTKLPGRSGLHNGQFVGTRIVVDERKDCLVVPADSVVISPQGEAFVALVEGDEAIPTPVQQGLAEGQWIEITGEGLAENISVVTSGAYGLPGRTRIRVMEK